MSRPREFQDCRECHKVGYHTRKAGCIIATERAAAVNEGLVPQEVLDNGLDLTEVIAQAAETDAQRPHYEVRRTSPVSSPRTGPGHTYTYRPKLGDVVIFPNGIELNYSEHDQTVVVTAPKGCGVVYDHTDGLLTLKGLRP